MTEKGIEAKRSIMKKEICFMKLKKVLGKVGTFLFIFSLMGTTAFAATQKYSFSLSPSESKYTSVVKKTTTTSTAYVTRQEPDSPVTTIQVRVWNSGAAYKSNIKKIVGVGTAMPSYRGYNVDSGDYLRLCVSNPTSDNAGANISAAGTWEP